MKGYVTVAAPPAKRRWKGVALAAVLALVVFSMLVPLAFLLGLHNRFPYGNSSDERSSSEPAIRNYERNDVDGEENASEVTGEESRIDDLVRKFAPSFSKDITESSSVEDDGVVDKTLNHLTNDATHSDSVDTDSHSKDLPKKDEAISRPHPVPSVNNEGGHNKKNPSKGLTGDETQKSCQLEFGSYCLWSKEHREVMKDSTVKRLKDQLFVARAYYPSIAKIKGQEKLSSELKQNIQEHERMLSEAILDADLPPFVEKKVKKMDQTISRAKACTVECSNVDKKLRQILDLTEDEAHFHMKQSAFLYHLGAQTMAKSFHCLSMRLTVEFFKLPSADVEHSLAQFEKPSFQHFVIFTRNILAVSVVINSTVMNSKETGNMVFHLLTDGQNYYAMKLWFSRNLYREAAIHVMNIEDINLNSQYDLGLPHLSVSEEFRVSVRDTDLQSPTQMRTEYISTFGHSHFLLSEIFKDLKKVVVLDDDIVVQRDLSSLWNLDMEGKVNGAVEFCGVRLGQLKSYLGSNSYDGNSCVWLSGLNIVDLEKWREHDVTGVYQRLIEKMPKGSEDSWRAAALPTSLLAFHDLIYSLDGSWVLSGLGHDFGVSENDIRHFGALHYNGNMKPWLELGIPKYKKYWKTFLTEEEHFMHECNVNP